MWIGAMEKGMGIGGELVRPSLVWMALPHSLLVKHSVCMPEESFPARQVCPLRGAQSGGGRAFQLLGGS